MLKKVFEVAWEMHRRNLLRKELGHAPTCPLCSKPMTKCKGH